MIIRFTSTLTSEDESRFSTALLKALKHLLAPFPISYPIRIETTGGDVVEDSCAGVPMDPWATSGSRKPGPYEQPLDPGTPR